MAGPQKAPLAPHKIPGDYCLCGSCLRRLFPKQLAPSPNKLPGQKPRKGPKPPGHCHICKNLCVNLGPFLESMLESSSKHDFGTFAVGIQIRPSIIDRDDFIRSKFKLRGTDSIKTGITRELSKRFSKKTRKTLDVLDPDLTFTINARDKLCLVRTKQVVLQGRYTKTRRGFPQKQKPCADCSGKGCGTCSFHGIAGFESVEGKISELLFSKFGCTTARFTWIGGEDKSSLVLGAGRPFLAKVQNPSRRRPRFARKAKLDFVELHNCKILESFPKTPIKFSSTIRIGISTENPLAPPALKKLKSVFPSTVVVYESSGKRSEKSVSCVKYKKTSGHGLVLTVDAEGGLPVKRFVEGDDVVPSISQILGDTCKCVRFDFMEIRQ